jgi:hypothetical protein
MMMTNDVCNVHIFTNNGLTRRVSAYWSRALQIPYQVRAVCENPVHEHPQSYSLQHAAQTTQTESKRGHMPVVAAMGAAYICAEE